MEKEQIEELDAAMRTASPFFIVAFYLAARALAEKDEATMAALERLMEPVPNTTDLAYPDRDLARAAGPLDDVERRAWASLVATCVMAGDQEALSLVEAALRRRIGN